MAAMWTPKLFLLLLTMLTPVVLSTKSIGDSVVLKRVPQDNLVPPDGSTGNHITPNTMSLTLTPEGASTGFIQIFNPPQFVQDGMRLELQFQCIGTKRVGVQLNIWTDTKKDISTFSQTWNCSQENPNQFERRSVKLRLKSKLSYRPSYWNQVTLPVTDALLRAWLIDADSYVKPRWNSQNFRFATAHVQYAVQIPAPYARPEAPATHCYSWWKRLEMKRPYRPKCPLQPEVLTLVGYPVALSGTNHGVIRAFPNYTNPELERERIAKYANPKWTLVMYVYIVDYCPSGRPLCSIFQRLKWDDLYMTPLIYVNQLGQLHLQVVCESGAAIAHLTPFSLPKHRWVRLVIGMHSNKWLVNVNYGDKWQSGQSMVIRVVNLSPLWYDSKPALHIIGGSEVTPSFKGYVGEAKVYRRLIRDNKSIPYPKPHHPMFGLGIGEKAKRCHDMLQWITLRIQHHRLRIETALSSRKCQGGFYTMFRGWTDPKLLGQCEKQAVRRSAAYKFTREWVKRQAKTGWQFKLTDVGSAIFRHATQLFEENGFEEMEQVVQLLKQSSCYGNHDASYFLASILNHGVGVKANEIMSHHYLMHATLDNHRLSLLALGNKHVYGLDAIPQDLEQAYVYYKNMGDQSRRDREAHKEDDVYTEQVRLTDDVSINEQTEEDGDLFLWFHHQAGQGVVRAQRDLARIMFWGSQGVKRNIKAAVEYYRMSAESGEPAALFDYGIVLLKGQGTAQNYTGALYYLRKAAAKGHAGAYNALGWYALEVSYNYTQALDMFTKAQGLGNVDATHNIGHMYLGGRHPNSSGGVNRIKAFEYFSRAALSGGQYDSSIMVAMYNMRGHPNATRDADLAVNWARYVSETNPALGRILAKGLKAYRHKNWPAAIMYYMLAADAGIEVGNFNLAFLCEDNPDGITSFIAKECVWKFYRLATKREAKFVDPYSWIKMGDYHWYGCEGKRDPKQAAIMYANAALRGDPHALFNLGFLVEEGIHVPEFIWNGIHVPKHAQVSNVTLLRELYYRCKESTQTEAYLPCTLALLRVELIDIWDKHRFLVKISSFLGAMTAVYFTMSSAYHYVQTRQVRVNAV